MKKSNLVIFIRIIILLIFLSFLFYCILASILGLKTTKRLERAILKNENVSRIIYCYQENEHTEKADILIELNNGTTIEFDGVEFRNKVLICSQLISINDYCLMCIKLYDDYNFISYSCWDYILDTKSVYEIIDNANWLFEKACLFPEVKTKIHNNRIFFDEVHVSDDFIEYANGSEKKFFRIKRNKI